MPAPSFGFRCNWSESDNNLFYHTSHTLCMPLRSINLPGIGTKYEFMVV
jgi:hypothetical protein